MPSPYRTPPTAKPNRRNLLEHLRDTRGAIDLASIMVGVLVIGIVGGVIAATVFAVVPFAQDEAAKGNLDAVNTAEGAAFVLENPNSYFAYDSHPDSAYQAAEVGGIGIKRPSERLIIETSPSGQYWIAAQESETGKVFYRASSNTDVHSIDPEGLAPGDLDAAAPGDDTSVLPATLVNALPADVTQNDVVEVLRNVVNGTVHNFGSVEKAGFGDGVPGPVAAVTNRMTSTWDTSKLASGTKVILPINGTVNVSVDWGDGIVEDFASVNVITAASQPQHTYATAGVYTVNVTGSFTHFGATETGTGWLETTSRPALTSITSWGETGTTDMRSAFSSANNLTSVPEIPSTVRDLSRAFYFSTVNPDISGWDTVNVTDMSSMFETNALFFLCGQPGADNPCLGLPTFNGNISGWDTGNVTDMSGMFRNAMAFNGNISSWDTGNVTTMTRMFNSATVFNQPLGDWDTSKVTDMSHMFISAGSFNQPLGDWDTGNVTNMQRMLTSTLFNHPVGGWNTSKVTDMSSMFSGTPFNYPLGQWDTSKVTNMSDMFRLASAFNQPLNTWDTSSVTSMSYMFERTPVFNQPLPDWKTGNVTSMTYMFAGAGAFNQNIAGWDTSKVRTMSFMFNNATAMSQDISALPTTSVQSWGRTAFRTGSGMTSLQVPLMFR